MKYLLLFMLMCNFALADDKLIYPYKSSFYLYDTRDIFQFSFRIKLLRTHLDEGKKNDLEGLFLGYTQLSYWKQGSVGNDNPYIYSNFNPEIHYRYKFNHPIGAMTNIQLGVEHQSDGLGKQFDLLHREWNRIYITPTFQFFDNRLNISTKFWYPDITPKYNADISKYMGYSEINFSTNILSTFWMPKTEVTFLKGTKMHLNDLSWCFENSIQIPAGYIHISTPLAFYTHWYRGYGESLKTYNKRTNNIRFGISLLL
jgi:phospholipase A1